jgi:DNA polymerase-3 subunit delta
MFWILHGEDEFRRSEFLATLKQGLGDPDELDINTTILDGRRATLSEIVHSCSAVPFLGKSRLVVIRDLLAPGTRSANNSKSTNTTKGADATVASGESASSHSSLLKGLKEYLPDVPDSTVLVFVESRSLSPRHPLSSLTQGASAIAEMREFRPFSASRRDGPGQLSRWIIDRAKKKGLHLSPDVVTVLATHVGYDLRLMDQELEKLSVYAADTGEVSVLDVRRLVPYVREADIFEMVDALGKRDTRKAIVLLHMMLDEGKAPLYLLTMIVRQFRIIIQVKELHARGLSVSETAKRLGLHEFVVKKGVSQARNFSFDQLSRIYDLLAESDTSIKTGRLNQALALDLLVAEVTLA